MLAPTQAPWIAERISRSMLHIFGSSVVEGYREVVCIADGERMEANSALICAAPEMAAAVLAGDLDAARATLADRGLA